MSVRKLYRPSWAAWVSLVFHLVWFSVGAYIFWAAQSLPEIARSGDKPADASSGATDALKVAADLGRLDLVAMCLTVLGVALAVMAFAGFFVVRAAAMDAAREEAAVRIQAKLPELLTPAIIVEAFRQHPQVLHSALRLVQGVQIDVSDDEADAIAQAANGD